MALLLATIARRTLVRTNTLQYLLNKELSHHHGKSRLLKQNIINNVFKRNFNIYSIFGNPTAAEIHKQDNMPPDYELIYNNKLTTYIAVGKLVSGVATVAVVLSTLRYDSTLYRILVEQEVRDDKILFFTAFFTISTLLHIIAVQIPLRIYYNRNAHKKYVFIVHGGLPFTTIRKYYRKGDVKPIYNEEGSLNPWADSKYKAKKDDIYLFDNFFRKPSDLNILVGYEEDDDDDDSVQF